MIPRVRFLWLVVPLALAWAGASDAHAGWFTLKNDTQRVIVVQETVTGANGLVKRGRPIRLFPGETIKEFQAGPTVKRVEVFEYSRPGKTLFCGNLVCKDENQTFAVTADGMALIITATGVRMGTRDVVPASNQTPMPAPTPLPPPPAKKP